MNPVREKSNRPRRWLLWAPALVYMAAIFVASSLSRVPAPPAGLSDKQVHAVVYAGLAAMILRALAQGSWRGVTLGTALGAVLMAAAYGASDEVHQWFVPGRTFEILDMVADAIGAVLASGMLRAWGIIRSRNPSGTLYVL